MSVCDNNICVTCFVHLMLDENKSALNITLIELIVPDTSLYLISCVLRYISWMREAPQFKVCVPKLNLTWRLRET